MQKIVESGLKIDLHIHSCASSHKDGKKVKNNTLENIHLLISKLNEQQVNMCAITDHDTFSYAIYHELKQAEKQENTILKVLPGVEFSVCFVHDDQESVIHVIAIFSDEDDDKVKSIETIIKNNPPENDGAYSEKKFLELLRAIDINTILIAHQKGSPTSQKTRKHDANTLGTQKFLEFICTDYFEAFEFKQKRNEIFNKQFLTKNNLEDQLRFVTGTDCHDWTVYPAETPSDNTDDFPYTFVKCLPTFKGLVMAITDYSRMSTVNSFFTPTNYTLPCIRIESDAEVTEIPLSKGINVIIGDNSIGKSMLLHAITGYTKEGQKLSQGIKKGYKKHLESMKLSIPKQIEQSNIFGFDMQGEVRSKFEENKLNASEFLRQYFPEHVDNSPYKTKITAEIDRMIEYLQRKFDIDRKLENLTAFSIDTNEEDAESMTFLHDISQYSIETTWLSDISSQLDTVIEQLLVLSEKKLDVADLKYISSAIENLREMKKRYEGKLSDAQKENRRMEAVATVIKNSANVHINSVSAAQKVKSAFTEKTTGLTQQISKLVAASRKLDVYTPHIESTKTKVNTKKVWDYTFVSRLNTEEINTEYFLSIISRVLRKGKQINWSTITESELKDILLEYKDAPILEYFRRQLLSLVENDLSPKSAITRDGEDVYATMSAGLNAQIYYDLLSYESNKDGIYIIDQPEDNVSQISIRSTLIERFKRMGKIRQIIMVTHNPQFVVNLDVDNLIFLSNANGKLTIQSGALEYACSEYSILDIVANNIDGGLDSIKKRWKRYEKTINL